MQNLIIVAFLPVFFAPGILPMYGFQVSRFIGLWYVLVLIPYLVWFMSWRGVRRTMRRAADHDHLLCPDCAYDLRTLDATGTCPECGRAYEHDAVRAQWVDAERRLKRKKQLD